MSDVSPEATGTRIKGTKIRRRTFLKRAVGTGLGLGLTVAGLTLSKGCESPEMKATRAEDEMEHLIQRGANMRTFEDKETVFNTRAGIDLPYSRLANVQRIRAISNPVERVMAAIGYLDVEKSVMHVMTHKKMESVIYMPLIY